MVLCMKFNVINSEIFKILKSKIRINILELLINNSQPLKFNELVKKLKISSSTLEYHLKKMTESGLLCHTEDQYFTNAYSNVIWSRVIEIPISHDILIYLKSHLLPILNIDLIREFNRTTPTLIPDLISLFLSLQNSVPRQILNLKLAGKLNLELEEKMIQMTNKEYDIESIEIITDYQNFKNLICYKNIGELFTNKMLANLKVSLIENINLYIAIFDEQGILCLPKIDNVIDYQECLFFNNSKGIEWLNHIFNYFKKFSKPIHYNESIIKEKKLFLKYLKNLKNKEKITSNLN